MARSKGIKTISFQLTIGNKRKEERVRYLKNYWVEKVIQLPKVKIHTSLNPKYSCAIAGISIEGITPTQFGNALFVTLQALYGKILAVFVLRHTCTPACKI